MPYVTWSRSGPVVNRSGTLVANRNQSIPLVPSSYVDGNESVYSFRTRDQSGGRLAEGELSGKDLRKELRNQYRTRYDNGHEFRSAKTRRVFTTPSVVATRTNTSGTFYEYRGPVWPAYSGAVYPAMPSPSGVDSDGARAIAATIPTAPEAGFAQFVGELREKLPQIVGAETLKKGIGPRSAGSEYLNLEFGLKPFINDLNELCRSIKKANKTAQQMKRDSGKTIRRGTTVRDERTFSDFTSTIPLSLQMMGTSSGSLTNTFFLAGWRPQVIEVTHIRTWFKGAYTYYLSEADDFLGKLEMYEQLANRVLGTRITPSTLWELAPWSWLVDWFSDTGTFINNVTALSNDRLVLRYGYLMNEITRSRTHTITGIRPVNGTGPWSTSVITESISKNRTRASPYGFGVNVGALSPQRWAILGALGMTKAPGTLRLSG